MNRVTFEPTQRRLWYRFALDGKPPVGSLRRRSGPELGWSIRDSNREQINSLRWLWPGTFHPFGLLSEGACCPLLASRWKAPHSSHGLTTRPSSIGTLRSRRASTSSGASSAVSLSQRSQSWLPDEHGICRLHVA